MRSIRETFGENNAISLKGRFKGQVYSIIIDEGLNDLRALSGDSGVRRASDFNKSANLENPASKKQSVIRIIKPVPIMAPISFIVPVPLLAPVPIKASIQIMDSTFVMLPSLPGIEINVPIDAFIHAAQVFASTAFADHLQSCLDPDGFNDKFIIPLDPEDITKMESDYYGKISSDGGAVLRKGLFVGYDTFMCYAPKLDVVNPFEKQNVQELYPNFN